MIFNLRKIFRNLNIPSVSMLLLLAVFLFTPLAQFQRVIYIYGLFFLWLISVQMKHRRWLIGSLPIIICIIIIAALRFVLSFSVDYSFNHYLAFDLPTELWAIVFLYYSKNVEEFKGMLPIIFLMIFVTIFLTIRGNILFPGASRYLATGSDSQWGDDRDVASSLFVGGYGIIFGLAFLSFPLILFKRFDIVKNRTLFYTYIVLLLICIIVGSYFTAIILTATLIVLSNVSVNKIGKAILGLIFFVGLWLFLKDYVLQFLIDVGNSIDSPMLTRRAEQALYGTYIEDYEGTDASRVERAYNAINNYLQSPIWGRLAGEIRNKQPSGHSELLGYFEDFGLLGCIYILFYYRIYFNVINKLNSIIMKRYYSFFFIVFLLFLIVDKFDTATATASIIFFIAPMMLLICDKTKYKQKWENSMF